MVCFLQRILCQRRIGLVVCAFGVACSGHGFAFLDFASAAAAWAWFAAWFKASMRRKISSSGVMGGVL